MPYVFIAARWHGGKQQAVNRIVIHGTVSPTVRGGARNVANFFATENNQTSAHFVVDPGEIIQCVMEDTIAWHDGTNTNSIGIEMCDLVDGPSQRWADENHVDMMSRTAMLVNDVAARHNVPLVKLTAQDIRAGKRGICGHADMRDAFPGSTTHYDPGLTFPWARFMEEVNGDMGLSQADKDWMLRTFARQVDVGFARDQIMTNLGFEGTAAILKPPHAADRPATKTDVANILNKFPPASQS